MAGIELNLIVIRSNNLDQAAQFYHNLGLDFVRHRHGQGAEHLSSMIGNTIFEIYPRMSAIDRTTATRIGFRVGAWEGLIDRLQQAGGTVVTPMHDSDWGRRVVIADPDGHRVELTAAS